MLSSGSISSAPISSVPTAAPVTAAPDLSWHPTYPDRIDPARSIQTASQHAFVRPPLLIPNNIPGAWIPIFPSIIPPRTSLAVPAQRTYSSNVDPIVNPAPPVDLTWRTTYPATVPRWTLPIADHPAYVSGAPFLGGDLRARAIYPDQFPPRRLRLQSSTFEIGGVLNVPKIGGWRPRYPDQLLPRPQVRTGIFAYVTSPAVLLNAAGCLTWNDVSFTQPTFLSEDLSHATFTDEALTQPDLLSEDLC